MHCKLVLDILIILVKILGYIVFFFFCFFFDRISKILVKMFGK
jgi:hypothetical protein